MIDDSMRRKLLKHQARSVPRYTSYPTAPHFTPEIDGGVYGQWLSELVPGTPASVYVHIPFCRALCWYCGCHMQVVRREAPVASYLEALERELKLVAAPLPSGIHVGHMHWGGGTPSLLSPPAITRLAEAIGRRFALSAEAEFAVEIDPRGFDAARAKAFRAAGVNRASIGVQDLTPEVQRAIHRRQSLAETRQAMAYLRDAGITRINVDLMYGLPRQTVDSMSATLDAVLALAPSRIALFGYAHVPWMKRHQRLIDEARLPDPGARLAQLQTAAERLRQAGYVAIGLDHFARADDTLARALMTGALARNFQGYTVDGAEILLGFGASAIGRLPQGYVQNLAPIRDYVARLREGILATARGVALDDEDRLRREVIERLMCDLRVDLRQVAGRHGFRTFPFSDELQALAAYADDGLLRIDGDSVVVDEAARPLLRNVASAFDRYLQDGRARHSTAL